MVTQDDFKAKGSGFISMKKFFNEKLGAEYFDKNWKTYYPQHPAMILTSNWYPIEPLVQWIHAAARASGSDFHAFVVAMNMFILESDLNGVYKFLMKMGGAKRIFEQGPQFVKTYLNCVDMRILANEKGYLRFDIEAPRFVAEWQIPGQEGANRGILKVCGNEFESFKVVEANDFLKNGMAYRKVLFEMRYR